MTRKSIAAGGLLGALLAFVMGSGLVAISSDSVTSVGNTVESGTFTPPSHDVQVAQIGRDGGCTDASYEDGPVTAAISSDGPNIDLNTGISGPFDSDLCIKNTGNQTGQLILSVTYISDTEVGRCEQSESDPAGGADTTCGNRSQGELRQLLFFGVQPQEEGTSPSCTDPPNVYFGDDPLPSRVLDADLAPGEICRVRPSVVVGQHFTDQQRLAAQTDRFQWDIVLTLQDVPAS